MKFTEEYLTNKGLVGQALTFDRMAPQVSEDGKPLRTGAFTQPNGDIILRVYAPAAKQVTARFDPTAVVLDLKPDADKVFEGTLVYDPCHTGPLSVYLSMDGGQFLSPYLPIYWTADKPVNYVEVPDTANAFCAIRDVPHGTLSREVFYSKTLGTWERCLVYTPAGYMRDTEKKYPVLYLQNGGGDNEICWEYSGRLSHILDNLMADGEAEPFIAVMCNASLREGGTIGIPLDFGYETMLINDVIPFIERTYRALDGRENRAIAGLSMGAYMTNDIIWHHPEIFGSVGFFTASMVHVSFRCSYVRPYASELKKYTREQLSGMFQLYFRSTTPQEDHMEFFVADDAIYHFYGMDQFPYYKRIVYEETVSKWNSWRMGLRDFAKLLFKA